MKTLRTPDERFTGLPGFDFAPNYVEIADSEGGTLRVHYLREGDPDATGGPAHARRALVELPLPQDDPGPRRCRVAGRRPDLVGFGRSDKPTERSDYTFARHVEWMRELLFDRLHLRGVTLVCQDWGGLIGLRLVGEHPERFARVVAANTFLPTGDTNPGEAFFAWQRFSQEVDEFPTGRHRQGRLRDRYPRRCSSCLRRPLPRRDLQVGGASVPDARAVTPRRPGPRRQRRRLGGSGRVRPALPVRLQRQRSHHQGRRSQSQGADRRCTGSAAHDHRGRRALPPGGPWRGVGQGRRGLRRRRRRDPRARRRPGRSRILRTRHGGAAQGHGYRGLRRPRPGRRSGRHVARQLLPGRGL